jgi:hypothetical protein
MSKSYIFNGPTKETKKLELSFHIIAQALTGLGMILGKEAPAIRREFDAAYQMISSKSGLLQNIVITHAQVAAFESKLKNIKSEIAMHSHRAEILKDIKTLRVQCLDYIKKHGTNTPKTLEAEVAVAARPVPTEVNTSKLYAKIIDGEPYIRLSDLATAFSAALEYYKP